MGDALEALVGGGVRDLSSNVVSRLKWEWQKEYRAWPKREGLGRWLKLWADGIYSGLRGTSEGLRVLLLRARWAYGRRSKTFVGVPGSTAAGTQDGDVLNCLPKSSQARTMQGLHEIWVAKTRAKADQAFDWCLESCEAKYAKTTNCLLEDRKGVLAFYDVPSEAWGHLHTTSPIESIFAPIRHRTARTKASGSRGTMLAMIFKLGTCAQHAWRRLRGLDQIAEVIRDVRSLTAKNKPPTPIRPGTSPDDRTPIHEV